MLGFSLRSIPGSDNNELLGRFQSDPASSAAAFHQCAEHIDNSALQVLEEAIRKPRGKEPSR